MLVTAIFTFYLAFVSALSQTSQDELAARSGADCKLKRDASVYYTCPVNGEARDCEETVPHGSAVIARCKPHYFNDMALEKMTCANGEWDNVVKCVPECGNIPPQSSDGSEPRGLPWHAVIYSKAYSPYRQICGGSLVSANTIISAAHCFWSEHEELKPEKYAVALGKMYKPWNDLHDQAQQFNVSKIHIHEYYKGVAAELYDIAVVKLDKEVVYGPSIAPVCLSFDIFFNLLISGSVGKFASWRKSPVLRVAEMSYKQYEECFDDAPLYIRHLITNDKFCTDSVNGSEFCLGDGGTGLAFPSIKRGAQKYYLQGVVSVTAVTDGSQCSGRGTPTELRLHDEFLMEYLST